MGHAGAIITGQAARAEEKIRALDSAGAVIIGSPGQIGSTVEKNVVVCVFERVLMSNRFEHMPVTAVGRCELISRCIGMFCLMSGRSSLELSRK
jgi:hypothetical protein